MASRHFDVELPEDLLAAFGWRDGEISDRVREALVMQLLRVDRISEAQAAALLGLDRWQLLETMNRYRVPAIRLRPEELKREVSGKDIKGGEV
jgi:uncharacterized protein UPF0175